MKLRNVRLLFVSHNWPFILKPYKFTSFIITIIAKRYVLISTYVVINSYNCCSVREKLRPIKHAFANPSPPFL